MAPSESGGSGRLAGEESLQIPAHAGVCDVEIVHVAVADDPLGVHEEPARNGAKSEHAGEVARTVDQDRKAHAALLDHGPDPLLTLDVLGDGKEAKAPRPVLPAPLPPGQLLATRSPGREAEEDGRRAEEIRPGPHPALEVGQDEVRQRISEAHTRAHSIGISLNARSTLTPCLRRMNHMIQ